MTDTPSPTRDETARLLAGLWRLNRLLGQDIDPQLEASHGIDMRSYGFLKMIQHGTYPKKIAEQLKLPGSLVSHKLDQLQTLGLIERLLDREDSRRIRLELTEAGRQLTADAEEALHTAVSARLAQLPPGALHTFLDALDRLTQPTEATP